MLSEQHFDFIFDNDYIWFVIDSMTAITISDGQLFDY